MDDEDYLEELVEHLGARGILLLVPHIEEPDTYLYCD